MGEEVSGRLWIRLIQRHKLWKDALITCRRDDPRAALLEALPKLDISQPLWLPKHQSDWEQYALTRFLPDQFMESVPFDCMEISYIASEEEKNKQTRRRNLLEDV